MKKATISGIIKYAALFIVSLLFINTGILYEDDSDFETEGPIQFIGEDSLVVNGFNKLERSTQW